MNKSFVLASLFTGIVGSFGSTGSVSASIDRIVSQIPKGFPPGTVLESTEHVPCDISRGRLTFCRSFMDKYEYCFLNTYNVPLNDPGTMTKGYACIPDESSRRTDVSTNVQLHHNQQPMISPHNHLTQYQDLKKHHPSRR